LGKVAPDLPTDQRDDDARSCCFDSAPLGAPLDLLGRAQVRLRVASDKPVATVVVRLCDVHPDGTSERITFGVANLTHRHGHDRPTPLVAGEPVEVVVAMKGMGHRLPPGHRLRLAISSTYWPMVWPAPEPATITVYESGSNLTVPVFSATSAQAAPPFAAPSSGPVGSVTVLSQGAEQRTVDHQLDGRTEVVVSRDDGRYVLDDIGTEQTYTRLRRSSITPEDPTSAEASIEIRQSWRRGSWCPRIEVDVAMSATVDTYLLEAVMRAFDHDELVIERRFTETIERLLA
jgi:hypothetical protein